MIVVTGADGFIGTHVVEELLNRGSDLVMCDYFENGDTWRNLRQSVKRMIYPDQILNFVEENFANIECIIHLGAISSTTEKSIRRLIDNNINFTIDLYHAAKRHSIDFIYASSAATYGDKEIELIDNSTPEYIASLRPLNAYGWSKNYVDHYIFKGVKNMPNPSSNVIGLKFFNVYGTHEDHKKDMASVVSKYRHLILDGQSIKLFKSHKIGVLHGEQKRDFIYVKDVVRIILSFIDQKHIADIFNVGTGLATSFKELIETAISVAKSDSTIEYVDMPKHLREKYQYYTKADTIKLLKVFPDFSFTAHKHALSELLSYA
jgi:ADP-L-glycero-D-manno-heptose 6-epimerase